MRLPSADGEVSLRTENRYLWRYTSLQGSAVQYSPVGHDGCSGARRRAVTLLPSSIRKLGVDVFDMKEGLTDYGIIMMLRLQNERMDGNLSRLFVNIFCFWVGLRKIIRRKA